MPLRKGVEPIRDIVVTMIPLLDSVAYRVVEMIVVLTTAITTLIAGITMIVRFIGRIRKGSRTQAALNSDLASKSLHFMVAYSFDRMARALPIVLYGIVLLVLNEFFSANLGAIGRYFAAASALFGFVFIFFGIVHLFSLSEFLYKIRTEQAKQFREEGVVNHSEDWETVTRQQADIGNIREFAILLRKDQVALQKRLDKLDGAAGNSKST